jgi:cytidine deaminase
LENDWSGSERVFTGFPERLQASVKASLVRGVLPSDRVAQIIAELGYSLEQLMIALLPVAAAHAHIPISRSAVGTVALGLPRADGPGNLYLGANFEFASQVLWFTIHAEQSAANNAWLHGEEGIDTLAVNAAPCGICRQFLNELTTNRNLKVLTSKNGCSVDTEKTYPLSRLLPDAYGPGDLGIRGGLMRAEDHRLELNTTDPVLLAALAACNNSYAPYTEVYAGIALRAADGAIYRGRYAENAAYNPSLLAIQSALASMKMQIGPAARLSIVEAVMVERSLGSISQREVTRLVLESISPTSTLTYYSI